jgi:hypothetical protein
MLRGQLKLDRFNKVSLARRFYLIRFSGKTSLFFALTGDYVVQIGNPADFVAPESELLSFNSLCRLGWSFSGNPAWTAKMLGLSTQPPTAKSSGARRGKRDKIIRA